MKILITGSNGLLGQKLVELLVSENIEVIATSKGSNRLSLKDGYIYDSMDITDADNIHFIFARYQPSVVINTAAMTNVDQCEIDHKGCQLLNVEAVKNLIDACGKISAHLIHLSTDFVFDGTKGSLTEEDQPNPISFYGHSKLTSEKLVIESTLKWSIIRTILVYGVAQDMSRSNIILWVKRSLESGKEIQVVNDQWRTPTLAEDLAWGCYLVAKNGVRGIFHISGDEMITPYQLALKTADFFELDKSLIKETNVSEFTQPAKRPPRTGFIIDKVRKVLGFEPKSIEEGLAVLKSQL